MAMQITVRRALLSDADAVYRLLSNFATSYQPRRSAFEANYPRLLEADGTDLLVSEVSGQVVGYVLATDSLTLFANGVVTELLELYVDDQDRGKGIGRNLVNEVVARARARGAVEVTVPTRRAGSFYRNLGFELAGEFFKLSLDNLDNERQ